MTQPCTRGAARGAELPRIFDRRSFSQFSACLAEPGEHPSDKPVMAPVAPASLRGRKIRLPGPTALTLHSCRLFAPLPDADLVAWPSEKKPSTPLIRKTCRT